MVCSGCGERFEAPDEWGEAVGEWYETGAAGMVGCPGCGAGRAVTEWEYDPPWGFGYLGFEFWNWPPFVEECGRRLGHRIVFVSGKL